MSLIQTAFLVFAHEPTSLGRTVANDFNELVPASRRFRFSIKKNVLIQSVVRVKGISRDIGAFGGGGRGGENINMTSPAIR